MKKFVRFANVTGFKRIKFYLLLNQFGWYRELPSSQYWDEGFFIVYEYHPLSGWFQRAFSGEQKIRNLL
jgi:hypothetical protein